MIGLFAGRKALRALRAEVSELDQRLATLDRQLSAFTALEQGLAVLSSQVAALALQLSARQSEIAAIAEGAARSDARITACEQAAAAQAEAVAALRAFDLLHQEAAQRLKGDIARLELQAARDLDEMRRTNVAIAASVLIGKRRAGVPPDEAQGDA